VETFLRAKIMTKPPIDILKRIDIGVRRGVAKALAEHKRLGQSIVVSQNGKVVTIPPEEIQVPPLPEDDLMENE